MKTLTNDIFNLEPKMRGGEGHKSLGHKFHEGISQKRKSQGSSNQPQKSLVTISVGVSNWHVY